jgi:predicted RNA binding protein YcfA (HicA-like mRNA interferase family)
MKLPRDMGGEELAALLGKYGYKITRQSGSHIRLRCASKGSEHHITVPRHKPLRVGTLSGIVNEIAAYLEVERQELLKELLK